MDFRLIIAFAPIFMVHLEMSDILKDITQIVISFESTYMTTLHGYHTVGFVLEVACSPKKNRIIIKSSSMCMSCITVKIPLYCLSATCLTELEVYKLYILMD